MNNGLDFGKFIHQYYSSEEKVLEIGFQNGEIISAWIIGHFYSDEESTKFDRLHLYYPDDLSHSKIDCIVKISDIKFIIHNQQTYL
jgi:hypothetical protein